MLQLRSVKPRSRITTLSKNKPWRVLAGLLIATSVLLPACQKTHKAAEEKANTISSAAKPAASTSNEHLGPKDTPALGEKHPILKLMASQASTPRAELAGKHPRVLVDQQGIAALKKRAATTHKKLWKRILRNLRVFNSEPPKAPAQGRRSQNVVGLGIAEAALAYVVEGDERYLQAAKKWMNAAVSYDVWGYTYSKPNVDLAAGHLLYGLGLGYDLLYNALTDAERTTYRNKLVRHAKLLADHYKLKPGRSFSYSQNHVYIPNAGLATAAYALYGEVPEAKEWASLSRAIMGRSLDTYSADGYFYESFEYFVFAVPWLVKWTTIHEQVTGEKLYDRPGFRNMHKYMLHTVLPGGHDVFDFGDAFSGTDTRLKKTKDVERTHPGGKLHSNYNLLHATARWFQDAEAQAVAQRMHDLGQISWYDYMSLIWYDATVKPAKLESIPTYQHFADHGVVMYRTDWSKNATAVAFKSGPPEGHATTKRIKQFPAWHLSSGHAHPDANSFILYANGEYLTGDSGYSGVPRTDQHNTVLVNGQGQRSVSTGHNAFQDVPYSRLNKIQLDIKTLNAKEFEVVGNAALAYKPSLGVKRFERRFKMISPTEFLIEDSLETEKPVTFSSLVHGDSDFTKVTAGSYKLQQGKTKLTVNFKSSTPLITNKEPNWMTAPGRPGSVQKGERESRGHRLLVSNAKPTSKTKIVTRLLIKSAK